MKEGNVHTAIGFSPIGEGILTFECGANWKLGRNFGIIFAGESFRLLKGRKYGGFKLGITYAF
jgi:hypothetical protein